MGLHIIILVCLSLLLLPTKAFTQERLDTFSFKMRLQEVSEKNFFKTAGYYNWCPSMVKDKQGRYHLFYSRWKKDYGWGGWLTHCEIAHAVSKKPTGPWKFQETVLTGRGKNHWDAITMHNPKIEQFDSLYYLYYISTNMGTTEYTPEELVQTAQQIYDHPNWKILRRNQRTGVAYARHLQGPWTRLDTPLIQPSGPITTLTVNPAVARGKNGKFYLIVKGDKPNETRFIRNQAVAIGDHPLGPFQMQPKPVIDYLDTEDMSIWYDARRDYFYGLFHATTGFIGLVSSPDGINWHPARDYEFMPKKLRMKNGEERTFDQMERPFMYVENDEPKVLCLALKKGDDSYLVFIPLKKA